MYSSVGYDLGKSQPMSEICVPPQNDLSALMTGFVYDSGESLSSNSQCWKLFKARNCHSRICDLLPKSSQPTQCPGNRNSSLWSIPLLTGMNHTLTLCSTTLACVRASWTVSLFPLEREFTGQESTSAEICTCKSLKYWATTLVSKENWIGGPLLWKAADYKEIHHVLHASCMKKKPIRRGIKF